MQPNSPPTLRRGQSSVELLVILAIGIAVLALVISSTQQNLLSSQDEVRFLQAKNSVRDLVQASNEVFSRGPGSRKQVSITIPEGTNSTSVSNRTIRIRVGIKSGLSDAIEQTDAAIVAGSIPTTAGTHLIWVSAREDGRVAIGNLALLVQPETVYAALFPSNSTQKNITITNSNNTDSLSVTLNLSRPASASVSVNWFDTTDTIKNIVLGAGVNTTLALNISSTQALPGNFLDGFVYANASNSETATNPISIIVSPISCTAQTCGTLSCYTSSSCASFCTGSNCPPSCGGGTASNISFITVETFKDGALTVPKQIFDFAASNITINGAGWNSSMNVSLDVRFPNASTIGSPYYPKNVSTNASGYFTDEVSPAGLPSGNNYTVRAQQNGATRLYSFNVTACS